MGLGPGGGGRAPGRPLQPERGGAGLVLWPPSRPSIRMFRTSGAWLGGVGVGSTPMLGGRAWEVDPYASPEGLSGTLGP